MTRRRRTTLDNLKAVGVDEVGAERIASATGFGSRACCAAEWVREHEGKVNDFRSLIVQSLDPVVGATPREVIRNFRQEGVELPDIRLDKLNSFLRGALAALPKE